MPTANPTPAAELVAKVLSILTDEERRELAHMGKGHRMFYRRFHSLRDKKLCWFDFTANLEILTPFGREVLECVEAASALAGAMPDGGEGAG